MIDDALIDAFLGVQGVSAKMSNIGLKNSMAI